MVYIYSFVSSVADIPRDDLERRKGKNPLTEYLKSS